MKKIFLKSGMQSGEWASWQEKRLDRKSKRTWQKNKRGDSKMESNDSSKIPDGGVIKDPQPPFRDCKRQDVQTVTIAKIKKKKKWIVG